MADNIQSQPELPLPTRIKVLITTFFRNLYTRSDGSINRCILSLVDSKAPAPATKLINTTTISTSDIQVDPSRNLWFRLFIPSVSDKPLPLLVYFHGGGFSAYGPDSNTFEDLCTILAANMPAVIASVNYRLAPEHKYPSQYDDGFDALKFIDSKSSAILPPNTDLSKCFIGGDSAGGNIAHHVTVMALQNYNNFNELKLAGVLLVQPFFGGEERTESELRLTDAPLLDVKRTDMYWRNFLPDGANRDHPAAHVVGGEAEELMNLDFPSSLVIVGGDDPLQDWQRRYVEWLINGGMDVEKIEYPNAFHGFYAFQELPEFAQLIGGTAEFVQRHANSN